MHHEIDRATRRTEQARTYVAVSDAVDLLVALNAVVVTVLTGTGHGDGHTGRMPGSDTSDLAETLVGLAGQLGGSPTGSHTLESVTLGDTNGVEHLVLREHLVGTDFLLEAVGDELDLVGSVLATVDLELHDVALLLAKSELVGLGVDNGAHNLGVLGDLGKLGLAILLALLGADEGWRMSRIIRSWSNHQGCNK